MITNNSMSIVIFLGCSMSKHPQLVKPELRNLLLCLYNNIDLKTLAQTWLHFINIAIISCKQSIGDFPLSGNCTPDNNNIVMSSFTYVCTCMIPNRYCIWEAKYILRVDYFIGNSDHYASTSMFITN